MQCLTSQGNQSSLRQTMLGRKGKKASISVVTSPGEATVVVSPNDVQVLGCVAGTVYLFHGEATVVASPNESGCITSPSFLSEINLNASMEIWSEAPDGTYYASLPVISQIGRVIGGI